MQKKLWCYYGMVYVAEKNVYIDGCRKAKLI